MLYNPSWRRPPRRPGKFDAVIAQVFRVDDETDAALAAIWANLERADLLGSGDRRLILESAVAKLLATLPPLPGRSDGGNPAQWHR
jgi:hypothetical protein